MLYQRSLILLFSFIMCARANTWYLSTDSGDVKELFDSKKNQEQDILKRFTPMNSEVYGTVGKNNISMNEFGYFRPNLRDFKNLYSMQISTISEPSTQKPSTNNEIKITSYDAVISLNNTSHNWNIINDNKRPKRKITHRKYTQKLNQRKSLNKSAFTQSRFLDVFEIVEFNHVPCSSVDGLDGTCVHEYNCQKIGGQPMGTCADGYGTCCVILFACDGRSSYLSGWFTNPGFPTPSSDRLSCTFTLDKYSNQVQQIRLDFMNFEILPPTSGTCEQDQFSVTGQNVNNVIPILCGINTGQHVYVEVSESEGPIVLSFQTISEENRLFSIKVTQIISSDKQKAPSGCLQYLKGEHGYLESFNYLETSQIGITRTPSYLNNLNYAICIERSKSSCSITYTKLGDMQIINYDSEGLLIIPPRQAGVEIFDCPSDWLLISALRLCGERLNDGSILQDFTLDAPVTDDGNGPIVVWFRSDGIYSGRGFKLSYQQNSCTK